MDFEIRDRSVNQGSRQGVSSREACKIVGINERTGKRWRNVRNPTGSHAGAPPITSAAPSVVRGRFLNEDERLAIADRRRAGATLQRIAEELGRDRPTISRELCRNAHLVSGDHRPHAAQARADARWPRPKLGKMAANPELRQVVQDGLDLRWSPEQIVRRLRPS